MKIYEAGLYHIYNRGNNSQPIFYNENDYQQFVDSSYKYLVPNCQILAWCLMPNHFHFLLEANEKSLEPIIWGGNEMTSLTNGFQLLQSNYAKLINNKINRTGSLFQQKTKAKFLENKNYAMTAFRYIHQNPVKANLVDKLADWNYSSYNEYCGLPSSIKLSNVELGKAIFEFEVTDFTGLISGDVSEGDVEDIFL
jgi:REP element-mobilizing transposase RayT